MRRISLFSIIMIVSLLSTAAPYDFEVNNIYYNIISNDPPEVEVTIRSYSSRPNTYKGYVDIPASVSYGGTAYTVTSIGMLAFKYCEDVVQVTLPPTINFIDSYAFENCTGLTEVIIPENVQLIAHGAFSNCYNLSSVTLLGGVDCILNTVFEDCTSLRSITLPEGCNTLGDYVFSGCTSLREINLPGSVESIGRGAFDNTPWLASQPQGPLYVGRVFYQYIGTAPQGTIIDIPQGCTSISPYACFCQEGLSEVRLPASLTDIGMNAFASCKNLSDITIPQGVKHIGEKCFGYCETLKSIDYRAVDADVTANFENGVFYGCTNVDDILIGDKVKVLPNYIFYGVESSNLSKVVIPASVKSIRKCAFRKCTGIKSLDLGRVDSICEGAFKDCESLTQVVVPNSTVSVGAEAFMGCKALASVILGTNVKLVGKDAFVYYKKTQRCLLPNLKKCIFLGRNLPEAYSSSGLPSPYTLDDYPNITMLFDDGGVKYIPLSITERTCAAVDCVYDPDFDQIVIDGTASYRGVNFRVAEIAPYTVAYNPYLRSLEVSVDDCDLPSWFAEQCPVLTDVNISNGGNIDSHAFLNAFADVDDAKVVLNNSGSIGVEAFRECVGIRDLEIGENVTDLRTASFWRCMTATNDGSVVIRCQGTIGDEAFKETTGIRNLTISGDVKDIGASAFEWSMDCGGSDVRIDNNGSVGMSSFAACHIQSLYVGGNVTDIMDRAFTGSIIDGGRLEISNTGSIGSQAFAGCGMAYVALPQTVASLGQGVFSDCTSITKVSLPQNLKCLPERAFSGCSRLQQIVLPDSLLEIGDGALMRCPIKSIRLPGALKMVGHGVFDGCTSLSNMVIDASPEPLSMGHSIEKNVGYFGLLHDTALAEISINRNITYDSDYPPLFGLSTLTTAVLGDMVDVIPEQLFVDCRGLKNVTLSPNITACGAESFAGCSDLTSLRFGDRLTNVGDRAFASCVSLRTLGVDAALPPVCGADALSNIDKWECTLYVPAESMTAYASADQWRDFLFVEDIASWPESFLPGDANGDDILSVADIVAVVEYILGNTPSGFSVEAADVNADGVVTVADIVTIVSNILSAPY